VTLIISVIVMKLYGLKILTNQVAAPPAK